MPRGYFYWNGAEDYKNEILVEYQKQLRQKGITILPHIKLAVQQVIQENGRLDPLYTGGDDGCALGIPQFFVCSAKNPGYMAKHYLAEHKEWQSWKFQVRWMTGKFSEAYARYNSNIKQTIVSHNCRACADANQDRWMCISDKRNFRSFKDGFTPEQCKAEGGFVSGYFENEVNKIPLQNLLVLQE